MSGKSDIILSLTPQAERTLRRVGAAIVLTGNLYVASV